MLCQYTHFQVDTLAELIDRKVKVCSMLICPEVASVLKAGRCFLSPRGCAVAGDRCGLRARNRLGRPGMGIFGRHAAGAMRLSGGCGGCWPPPGHRPGWCNPQRGLIQGRASSQRPETVGSQRAGGVGARASQLQPQRPLRCPGA